MEVRNPKGSNGEDCQFWACLEGTDRVVPHLGDHGYEAAAVRHHVRLKGRLRKQWFTSTHGSMEEQI